MSNQGALDLAATRSSAARENAVENAIFRECNVHHNQILSLLEAHSRLVKKIAREEGFDIQDFEDVRQQAALALLEAQQEFDGGRGAKLTTYWLEGKLRPALRRDRAATRFGVELDDENVIFELPAQELEEKEGDQLDEILTPEEWETLGQLSDSAVLAQALGVQRRRAQQKINETIQTLAGSVRARLGLGTGEPLQLGLGV